MTTLTALEIAANYPDNIQINSAQQENGKFAAFCYRLRDNQIHKLLLSTQPMFDTEQEANDAMTEVAIACKNTYGK